MLSPAVFSRNASRDQFRDLIADLVMLLHSNKVWPKLLYPAGSSKAQAMKRAFDLTRRNGVLKLAERIIGTRRWPEIGGGRYWSDTGDEDGEDRFVLDFAALFQLRRPNYVLIEHSPRFAEGFRDVIAQLGRIANTPFVVFALSRETAGEIVQASTGDGVWMDAKRDTEAVRALARLAERD